MIKNFKIFENYEPEKAEIIDGLERLLQHSSSFVIGKTRFKVERIDNKKYNVIIDHTIDNIRKVNQNIGQLNYYFSIENFKKHGDVKEEIEGDGFYRLKVIL